MYPQRLASEVAVIAAEYDTRHVVGMLHAIFVEILAEPRASPQPPGVADCQPQAEVAGADELILIHGHILDKSQAGYMALLPE